MLCYGMLAVPCSMLHGGMLQSHSPLAKQCQEDLLYGMRPECFVQSEGQHSKDHSMVCCTSESCAVEGCNSAYTANA